MWVLDQENNKQGASSNQETNLEGGEGLCDLNASKLPESSATGGGAATSPQGGFRDFHPSGNQQRSSPLQYGEDSEGHISAGSSFLSILERELVHPTTFTQTFLQSILSSIDSRDPVVANAWLETLLDVIDLLPPDVIRNEILNIAISKGQISQPLASRIACCKLLGKIASKFEPYLIQQELLPLVLSLCQDVQSEVRASVCSQLPCLARGLGSELARPALLPSLVEMASDEDAQVRLSAVQAVADIIALLDHESRQQIIVPLVRKLCEGSLRSEDAVLLAVSKQIGHLCYSLADQMCIDDKRWLLHFYVKMCQLGAPLAPAGLGPMPDLVPILDRAELHGECRHFCAFNLPAMLLFGLHVEPDMMQRVFCDLASDICYNVRRTIAACLHEVARLLGGLGCGPMVRSQLSGLLCDSAEEVLESLVPHLGSTLEMLAKSAALKSQEEPGAVLELCRSLLHCEEEIAQTNNWRLQTTMLSQLTCLPHCVAPDLVFTHFVPRMFTKMHKARPLPCRVAAAKALLTYLSHLTEEKHRNAVLARLNAEFLRGESCYSRMLYLRMIPDAMAVLSPSFFKQHIFTNVLKLAGDRVANIQLEVCSLLCPLKEMLRLPLDRHLLHELESCVGSLLLSAKDRDVNAALAMAIQQLDKIELPASSQQQQQQQQQDKDKPGIGSRMDVTRRSISAQHRTSAASRLSNALSLRGLSAPSSDKGAVSPRRTETTPQPDNRTARTTLGSVGTKPRKPAAPLPDTKIPQSTTGKPTAVAPSISQVDPSTDEFYIDAGIRITPVSNSTKIPNLQEILHQRASLRKSGGNDNNENKMENVRSRLELNQISINSKLNYNTKTTTTTNNGIKINKPERPIKTSLSRDSSPGKTPIKITTPVTLRNQPRPQSVSSNSRKSLNLERNVTRRSLPPQERVSVNSVKRNIARPQSCVIVEPKNPRQNTNRSLSQESLQIIPPLPQRASRLTVTSRIPKVNSNNSSPGTSRSTSPNVDTLKYIQQNRNNRDNKNNLDLKLKQHRSTPTSRDPSPNLELKFREITPSSTGQRKSSRMSNFQQKRPGPSYTAPSSRGSSPDGSQHRFSLTPIRQSSMPASPSSPLPPSRLPIPASISARYQWSSHDFG